MDVGSIVTCRHAVPAYYSEYAGLPKMEFLPGMRGEVKAIAPKVCIKASDKTHDSKDTFLVVDFYHPECGEQRVGLNFCNAKRLG